MKWEGHFYLPKFTIRDICYRQTDRRASDRKVSVFKKEGDKDEWGYVQVKKGVNRNSNKSTVHLKWTFKKNIFLLFKVHRLTSIYDRSQDSSGQGSKGIRQWPIN